jgi:hypothetical protein
LSFSNCAEESQKIPKNSLPMNELYKETIERVVKEFNSNSKDGLDDGKIKLAMQ